MEFTIDKYPENIDFATGTILSTLVILRSGSNLSIPATFEGNVMAKSDLELQKMVLDDFYNRMYPNRAENEAIAGVKAEIDAIKTQALTEVSAEVDKVKELVKVVTLTVNELIAMQEGEADDEGIIDEANKSTEGGVSSDD